MKLAAAPARAWVPKAGEDELSGTKAHGATERLEIHLDHLGREPRGLRDAVPLRAVDPGYEAEDHCRRQDASEEGVGGPEAAKSDGVTEPEDRHDPAQRVDPPPGLVTQAPDKRDAANDDEDEQGDPSERDRRSTEAGEHPRSCARRGGGRRERERERWCSRARDDVENRKQRGAAERRPREHADEPRPLGPRG